MNVLLLSGVGIVLALSHVFSSSDLFVDSRAAADGDGSERAPFQSIQEALAALSTSGATVTVKGGVYREMINVVKGGTAETPLMIRAAAGEQVMITGFEPLSGWRDEGGGRFSLEVWPALLEGREMESSPQTEETKPSELAEGLYQAFRGMTMLRVWGVKG